MSATLTLPTTRSEIDKRWISQKFLVIGAPGVGKSSLFSTAEKTLYIQTEAGLNHLSVIKMPCRSWAEFKEILSLLTQAKNEGKMPYDTVCVDSLDKWIDLAHEEVIERGKAKFKNMDINVVGDIPNGSGWFWTTELIENALDKLTALDICVVLIGHLEVKEIKEPTRSVHKLTVSVGGKLGGMLCAWCDHLLSVEAKTMGNETKRTVKTQPTASLEAKSRGALVPDGWTWTGDIKANYDQLRKWFN